MKKHSLILSLAAVALVLTGLPLGASSLFPSRQPSPLPVETVHASSGNIGSVRAWESGGLLHVSGHVRKAHGRSLHYAAHVDIQLVAADGRLLASRRDAIDPAHPLSTASRTGRYSYTASFPLDLARQAAHIRVIYHPAVHGAA